MTKQPELTFQDTAGGRQPGAFRFILPSPPGGGEGEELFKIEHDGKCYCRGELVETNPEVWAQFKRWLEAAVPTGSRPTGCTCAAIQALEPFRHLCGCPLHRPLPPDHPEAGK
jgi:hypothetical protein